LNQLDEIVLSHGGRIYLAKDARLQPESMLQMYPRLTEWQAIKSKVDPKGMFSSDLSRRLKLGGV
jgi:FAD/FMN-containing dehydrogenase